MNVGKRITYFREQRNITTNKLANKAGISQSYLRDVELEKKNPTIEIISYICEALNLSLAEFFSEDDMVISHYLLNSLQLLDVNEQHMLADLILSLKGRKQ